MNMTVKAKNLQNRKGRLHFRLQVPERYREALGGKREIVKSLGMTADRLAEAIVEANLLTAEWNETFKRLDNGGGDNTRTEDTTSEEDLQEFFRLNGGVIVEDLQDGHLDGARHILESSYKPLMKDITKALYTDDLSSTTLGSLNTYGMTGNECNTVLAFVEFLGYTTADRRAIRGLLRVLLIECRRVKDEIVKEFPQLDVVPRFEVDNSQSARTDSTPNGRITTKTLPEVLEECLAVKDRAPQTEEKMKVAVAGFVEWCGVKDVSEYTPSDVKSYVHDCLYKLPVNAKHMEATRDLKTLKEQIKTAERLGMKTLTPRTVNNRYGNLTTVFKFAEKHMTTVVSPCIDTIKVDDAKKLEAEYTDNSFSDTEVKKIIKGAEKALKDASKDASIAWRGWIPLILCYTGMRLNEACSMDRESLQFSTEENVWFFDLKADTNRKIKVKNSGSRRRVPVPSHLINLGFIEWFQALPSNQHDRMWGRGVTYDTRKGHWTRNVSRYFKDKVKPNVLDKGRDVTLLRGAHSLRHSFQRHWQDLELPQRELDEYVGHSSQELSGVAKTYQGRLKLSRLDEAAKRFNW